MKENPNSKSVVTRFALATLTLYLTLTAGCCKGPRPLFLSIQATDEATRLSIPIYVGSANQLGDRTLLGENVDTWLANNSSKSSGEIKTFRLATMGTNYVIRKDDLIWQVWRGPKKADHVVVIADLPRNRGSFTDNREGNDKRRSCIPLERKLWREGVGKSLKKPVLVEIRADEVKLITQPGK